MPKRIQMTRQKPWRADNPDAVIVARPTWWGNPFENDGTAEGRKRAVELYRTHVIGVSGFTEGRIRDTLAGKDLACWCPLDQPCHADVLLEIANAFDPTMTPSVSRYWNDVNGVLDDMEQMNAELNANLCAGCGWASHERPENPEYERSWEVHKHHLCPARAA